MKQFKRIIAFLTLALMLVSLNGFCTVRAEEAKSFPKFQGKDFEGNDVDETMFSKNALTVVSMWFNGCSACVDEMAGLEKFNEKLKEKGAEIVGFNVEADYSEEALKQAKEIVKKQGVTYRNFYLTGGDEAKSFVSEVMAFPQAYLVDRNGKIVGQPIAGAINSVDRKSVV